MENSKKTFSIRKERLQILEGNFQLPEMSSFSLKDKIEGECSDMSSCLCDGSIVCDCTQCYCDGSVVV